MPPSIALLRVGHGGSILRLLSQHYSLLFFALFNIVVYGQRCGS